MTDNKFPKEILKKDTKGDDGQDEIRKKAYLSAMNGKVKDILRVGGDAKTIKGRKHGVETAILYMAPANISGYEVCPSRTKGCTAVCLFTSGQGRFPNVIQGRLRKTYQYLFRTEEFFEALVKDTKKEKLAAEKKGMTFCVRLNGTSDIAYEEYAVEHDGEVYAHIFDMFPNVQWYDYTKRIERLEAMNEIPNYHATFSRAETKLNHEHTKEALELGVNTTVVFRKELPPLWNDSPVVDGDRHDIRFWDKLTSDGNPVVIGLTAKGKAVKDTSGFVVDV